MVSARRCRRTIISAAGCSMFVVGLYSILSISGTSDFLDSPLETDDKPAVPAIKTTRGRWFGGARHVNDVAGDYQEIEYTSSVQEKADVDAILQEHWAYNKSAAEDARREMFAFFNPYKIITMTSDDAIEGRLQRVYQANAIPVNDVPPGISRLLPRRQLFRDVRYRACAVVGNGGILFNSSCGRSIDSSDFVIRCNFAEMEGFESDVGTQTDVVTFNPSILGRKFGKLESAEGRRKFLERLKFYGEYVLWLPIFSPHSTLPVDVRTILTFYEWNADKLKDVQLAFPGNILPEILDFWMSKGVDEERISTGLLMYTIASTICDRIHLYGFYPFPEYNHKSIPYHYEDARTGDRSRNSSEFISNYRRFHRLPDEFVYLKKMHRAGALQLHVGECDW